jgi:hypothetical protein
MSFFSVNVDIEGLQHKFDTTAELADDLDKPLRVFGAYLLRKTRARYKAQAFAPLAESTIEARAKKGLQTLERGLKRDVRRAFGRARAARGKRGLVARLLSSQSQRALDDVLATQSRGVQNRQAVLAEFERNRGARWGAKGGKLADRVQAKSLNINQRIGLLQREARAVMRQVGKPILGGLDRTLQIFVEEASVTLKSATHEEWSEAHNAGATVGHGAKLPERKTIFVEQSDLEVLRSILIDHQLIPFQEGLEGPGY